MVRNAADSAGRMAHRLHRCPGMAPVTRRDSGYTVIEMLMVMIVISVLAAVAYTRAGPALERARVRGAASLLATDLQYAQTLAAQHRVPMVISVDVTGKAYQIATRGGGTVYRARDFGSGSEYALGEFSAAPVSVEVFPNSVVAQSATYTVGLNGYRRQVTFSRAGQIRVATIP